MNLFKIIVFCSLSINIFAQTIFTYQPKSNEFKKDYDYDLLKLALEKTKTKYGDYKLIPAKKMNAKRRLKLLEANHYKNYVVKRSYSSKMLEKLDYIPIPIDRGIVGYRLLFVSPKVKNEIKNVETINELKKYKFTQGIGWLDAKILKANGLKVHEGTNYQGLFTMVAGNRIDILPLGANDIFRVKEKHKDKDLHIDKRIAIFYPLPRFFFLHKSNKNALKRLSEGLKIAYQDGSFVKLWNNYFEKSIKKANLKNKKIFILDNPYLDKIDQSYKKYMYKP